MTTLPQSIYLKLMQAEKLKDQAPEYVAAQWYHLFWFLVPFVGFLIFIQAVKVTYRAEKGEQDETDHKSK